MKNIVRINQGQSWKLRNQHNAQLESQEAWLSFQKAVAQVGPQDIRSGAWCSEARGGKNQDPLGLKG